MYSLGSTVETSKNDSVFVGQERNCTAIDRTTGEFCGETESLKILDEFQKLYETRIEEVDRELEGEFERVSTKLQIMKEWIRDLGEQNVMLVHTVEDLEQAACSRVKLLEEKLRQSSTIVSENMTKSNHTEKAIDDLSQRVNDLEKDELCMQQKIEYLQSDIRGLLEFIRRARTENRWQLDGIKFFEIEPNDILTPNDCTCGQEETNNEKLQSLKLQVEQLQENERKMIAYQTELKEKITVLTKKLNAKEDSIKKYVSQLQSYSGNIKKHSKFPDQVICNSLATNEEQQSPDIVLMADIVENMLVDKDLATNDLSVRLRNAESKLIKERETNADVDDLRNRLNEKHREIQQIQQQMASLQKESLETREVLTAEVAEKHDTVMLLHKRINSLEEQFYDASMQIQFREDIIKEMRKELKQSSIKRIYSSLSPCTHNNCNRVIINDSQTEHSELYKRTIAPKVLYASARHKNSVSFLHGHFEGTLDNKRIAETLTTKTKADNSTIKTLRGSKSDMSNKAEKYKYLRDIDKKILRFSRKLSPPSKSIQTGRSKSTVA